MIFNDNAYLDRLTQLVRWGHWYCFANIVLAIILSSLYVIADPFPDTLIGAVYLFANWFGHIAFLGFFVFIITIFPFCFIFPNSHFLRGWGSLVASTGLAFLMLDIWLYLDLGLHLQISAADVLVTESKLSLSALTSSRWLFFVISFIVLLGLQLALSNFVWRRLDGLQNKTYGFTAARVLVSSFVLSHLVHIWADAVLYQPIVRQDNMFPLSYPATAKTLMSKHGLIDQSEFTQRKKLKLNIRNRILSLDANDASCPAPAQQKTLVVAIKGLTKTDLQSEQWQQLIKHYQLSVHNKHIDTGSTIENSIYNLLTGLPEIYRLAEGEQTTLMAQIVSGLNQRLLVHPNDINSLLYFVNDRDKLDIDINWQGQASSFMEHLSAQHSGISFAIVDKSFDLASMLEKSSNIIITGLNAQQQVPLLTNIATINRDLVTGHTDVVSSLYQQVYQCGGSTEQLALGQNMFNPERNWLVNSQGQDIQFYQGDIVITLSPNGSYRVKSLKTQQDIQQPLDMALLTRAATYLHRLFQ